MAEKLPERLYHYTNINALSGIIVNKKLWLGSLRHMNDASEELYFIDLLKKAVIVSKHDITDTQCERIDSMFKKLERDLSESPAYVSCFSKRKDDAAQWERYADQGAGFCIEFDAQKLDKFIRGDLFLQEVYYRRDVLKHEHIDPILEWLENPEYTGGFNTLRAGWEISNHVHVRLNILLSNRKKRYAWFFCLNLQNMQKVSGIILYLEDL